MHSANWALALLGGLGIVISALVYGALINRRSDFVMKPTKQENAEEMAIRIAGSANGTGER
jgi:hypothetical protein